MGVGLVYISESHIVIQYFVDLDMNIEKIKNDLRKFAKERDWEQFHSPKNLAMALSGEVGELAEIFQWLSEEQSNKENISNEDLSKVREEVADILLYIIRLSDKLDIDLDQAILDKLKINESKYPIELSKGNSTKYNRRNE
jgi:NTP pyrophosphatase (non-canonical NTP hydrolase)